MSSARNGLLDRIRRSPFFRSSLFRFGLPFMLTIVGGSFWLRDFTKLRYEFRVQKQISKDELQKMLGVPMKKEKPSPEQMLKEVSDDVQDDYEIVRGPRPWEDRDGVKKMKEQALKAKNLKEV